MYCPKCGKEIITNAKFCGSCGAQIEQSIMSKASASTNNDTSNKTLEGASFISAEEVSANTSKKNKTIGIIIVAVGAIIGFFIIIGFIFNDDEPIKISNVSFETSDWSSAIKLSMDIENISKKDIAYIYIDTYAYDKMGTEISMESLQFTGPLESGESDSLISENLFYESGIYAVWPKKIKVVYIKGGETTFENDLYCYKDGFYKKGLK